MSRDGHSRAALAVSVVDGHGRPVRAPGLAAWLARMAPARARGSVAIALVSDARIRTLNRSYRGKDVTTDVLSFTYWRQASGVRPQAADVRPQASARGPRPEAGPTPDVRRLKSEMNRLTSDARRLKSEVSHLGDIVIARGVARRQARAHGHPESAEWRVLALHGLLHLLGYDHDADDGAMARAEARLRRRGGLPSGLIERGARA
jgi:probable rRNA maturation factor